MQNRTIEIKCRLNHKEADTLNNRVKKSGLSRENYLRQIINGLVPTEAPPPDYFAMMKELHYIGVNLNQIARKAHALNVLDVKRYDDDIAMLNSAVVNITNAVMLPRKIERKIE
jgi:ACT domain-containing protein